MPTNNPQLDLIAQEQEMQRLLATSTSRIESYYSEANTVFCVGENCTDNSGSIWVDGEDNTASAFVLKEDPENGLYYFEFLWEPGSLREGDYYLCYTYTPVEGGDKITDYMHFYVKADITNDVAIPTHATPPNKYNKLFDAYTPEMYKLNYTPNDKSADTIAKLNSSVGSAFTLVEDQAARLIDILDANVTPEIYLKYLANFFGLSLTTQDPTRWRGQIKKAIPLYKKKGTLEGLKSALNLSGMNLNEFIQYWQIDSSLGSGSPYFWTESFVYETTYEFKLSKISLPNNSYFELEVMKQAGSDVANQLNRSFVSYSLSNVTFTNLNGKTIMTWVGDGLEVGDIIKITYQLKFLPSEKNLLYQYFMTLDYQDTRDVQFCDIPPKNWNIRLIDEKDSYFPFLVPIKNPFSEPPVFGQIRTVFPYSENIYNMDEYNGSLRDSNNPKDIDNKYMEPCSGGISAHFCLDITIENLGDFSLKECQEIINNYTPFHSVFCHIIFSGSLSDYVLPPSESLDILVNYIYDDFMLAGSAQQIFVRGTSHYLVNDLVKRNQLTESLGTVASGTIQVFNDQLNVLSLDPSVNFNSLKINSDSSKVLLSINAPSVYSGNYLNAIEGAFDHGFKIKSGVFLESPTVLTTTFNYSLFNVLYTGNARVVDATEYALTDKDLPNQLKILNIKTKYDVQNGLATTAWKVNINSNIFTILYINNNFLYLETDGSLPKTNENNKSFKILDGLDNIVYTSTVGSYQTCIMAKVSEVTVGDFSKLSTLCVLNPNFKVVLQDSYYDRYTFIKFKDDNQQSFIIDGYEASTTPQNISISMLQVLVNNQVGKFSYSGLKISKPVGWPAFNNAETYVLRSGNFPENYLLKLTSGTSSYYKLTLKSEEYDPASSSYVHIDGRFLTCGTTNTSTPTVLSYELKKYAPYEDPDALITWDGDKVYYYNRSGSETINMETYNIMGSPSSSFTVSGFAPMSASPNGISSDVQIKDGIVFKIEYIDGDIEEGEIK